VALIEALIGDADDDETLAFLAGHRITEHLRRAAMLWVLAYPHEAAELRHEHGATSANKFLSLAEGASLDAVNRS
jgi:hypothetical protein